METIHQRGTPGVIVIDLGGQRGRRRSDVNWKGPESILGRTTNELRHVEVTSRGQPDLWRRVVSQLVAAPLVGNGMRHETNGLIEKSTRRPGAHLLPAIPRDSIDARSQPSCTTGAPLLAVCEKAAIGAIESQYEPTLLILLRTLLASDLNYGPTLDGITHSWGKRALIGDM